MDNFNGGEKFMGFVGRVLVGVVGGGEGGDKNDWGVSRAEEGGMGPALDGLAVDGVGSSERGADDDGWEGPGVYVCSTAPAAAGQETVRKPGNVYQLFLSFPLLFCALSPPPPLPQFYRQGSRAFSDTAAAAARAQCFLTLLLGLSLDLVALAAE